MNKVRFHTPYIDEIKIDIDTDRSVDIYIDAFDTSPVPQGEIRIVITIDPMCFDIIELIKNYPDSYTYVLTYYEVILNNNPKARYFIMANTWVDPFFDYKKKFCVSTIVGGKLIQGFEGHLMRHELWYRQNEITIPKNFYLSNDVKFVGVDYNNALTLPLVSGIKNSKTPMFDCMFHIAIENHSVNNYFTEKVIDCFLSRTIPIYYGDKNIGKHFNENGMIMVNNVDEIIKVCNMLTPVAYERMLPIVLDNYETALDYQDANIRIKNGILKVLEEKTQTDYPQFEER